VSSPTAIELHAGAGIQNSPEEWLKKADPVRETVEEHLESSVKFQIIALG
jgi:hypothetical protein